MQNDRDNAQILNTDLDVSTALSTTIIMLMMTKVVRHQKVEALCGKKQMLPW